MIVKLYCLMWLIGFLSVGLLYLTGLFTPLVAVVFGFLSFGAIYMGMVSVLPITMSHSPTKH